MNLLDTELKNRLHGQSDAEIKRVFDAYSEKYRMADESRAEDQDIQYEVALIPQSRLGEALKVLHFRDTDDDAIKDIYLMNASSHCEKGMTFQEFLHTSRSPARIQQWLETLDLPRMLAICMPQGENDGMYEGLGSLWSLDKDNIKSVVSLFAEQVRDETQPTSFPCSSEITIASELLFCHALHRWKSRF